MAGRQIHPRAEPSRAYAYIAMDNIEAGTGRIVNFGLTMGKNIASAKTSFARGDVLYGRLRPYLQKATVAPFDGIAATEIIPLRPGPTVHGPYLREFFLSPIHLESIRQLMSGARMPRLRTEDLLQLAVPMPSPDEQRRIADAVRVFRHRSAGIQLGIRELRRLVQAQQRSTLALGHSGRLTVRFRAQAKSKETGADVLKRILEYRREEWETAEKKRLNEPESSLKPDRSLRRYPSPVSIEDQELPELPPDWCWATLSQLTSATEPLCYGVIQPGSEDPNGIPLVRVQDVQDGTVRANALRRIAPKVESNYERSRLGGGEILVSVVGTIGRVAVVPPEAIGANIARALAKIKVAPVLPVSWVANALASPRIQEWMARGAREVARKTLNISTLEGLAVPVAPLPEIFEIVRLELEILGALQSLDHKLDKLSESVSTLLVSVMDRVFRGQLKLGRPSSEAIEQASDFLAGGAEVELAQEQNKSVKSGGGKGDCAQEDHEQRIISDKTQPGRGVAGNIRWVRSAGTPGESWLLAHGS
jgi:type I restriction enzyme S subunit